MDLKEKVKDIFDSTKEPAAEMACSLFLEGVAGTVVPGVMSSVLAYKQKRQERMFEQFMLEVKSRLLILEEKLVELEPEEFIEFKDKYFGLISDYALDEVQEDKIKYIANGFINSASLENLNENFLLMYFDTLKELRILDIGVLKFYYEISCRFEPKTYRDVLSEFNIEYEQYEAIRERLIRLGLINSKREQKEDDLYKNILILQEAMEKIIKDKKMGTVRFNRLERRESFVISKFGRDFVEFFMKEEM